MTPSPLRSLRLWLLAAMLVAGVVGLAASYVIVARIQSDRQRTSDRSQATNVATAVAAQAAAGVRPRRFHGLQAVLPDVQLIVFRNGRLVYRGPAHGGEVELTVTVPYRNGRVTVRDYEAGAGPPLAPLMLAAAGGSLLVILAGWLVATAVTRAVRGPIERAVDAADRLAGGDLSARMGSAGPQELARLGRAFDSMAERLEDADAAQRRFLADVAHEIATPTNAISGYGIALADGTLLSPEERREARELIERETHRLSDLILGFRELTRLDLTGGVHVGRVDLCELCKGAVARFRLVAQSAHVSLEVHGRELVVETDGRLVDMIVDNLLSNALRYTPAGGRVDVHVRRSRHDAVVAVRDTGIGIDPEQRDRVFDRLYRVDEARDRAHGGSGLGLAIAQRAAVALGGRIELESEPGRGSEFRLVLGATRRGARSRAAALPRGQD
jgi:signal transduction histidine kinase